MELLQYLKIALRWWWLILLPTLVVGIYSLATYRAPAGGYALTLRYTAAQPGLSSTDGSTQGSDSSTEGSDGPASGSDGPAGGSDGPADRLYDSNYYRWLTSEYIVNALKDWTRTGNFIAAVNAKLAATGSTMPAAAISGADNARSILIVYLATGLTDPQVATEQLRQTAEAVTAVLQEQNAEVFPQLGGQAAVVTPLDSPSAGAVPPSLRSQLELPLKLGLGLAVGLALALAAHYLDPFVREKTDLEKMGMRVIAEMPRTRRRKVSREE